MEKGRNGSKILLNLMTTLGVIIAASVLAWGIYLWFAKLPNLKVDESMSSHLFLNQFDGTAYGQIKLLNNGYKPLTIIDAQADLIVNIEDTEKRLPLTILIDSKRIESQGSARAILSLFASDLPLPEVMIHQGKINYKKSDKKPVTYLRPSSGSKSVKVYPSDKKIMLSYLMFLRIDDKRDWQLYFDEKRRWTPLFGQPEQKLSSKSI